ncbi:MAG TPA: sodium:solute symporter family protein [Candidatus Krumholzibacteria bacterium]|nr:sodium:solute symporter family protein [Candidatus Krumholzibacteria bacterium]
MIILSTTHGWLLLAGLALLWVVLGIYWGRRAKSLEGFMLANRNVGLALGTATAVATWITSNTTMLAPQFALQLGLWGILAYCTASIGLFLFAPMARRIRELMPNGFTSTEFVRLRYGKTAWIVFLIISLFYAITWMVSMGMAGGILLESLAGIPYAQGMSVILGVCVLYTLFGGLYAVIGTDFIQSLIILVGTVAVAITVIQRVPLHGVYDNLEAHRPELLRVLFPAAIMAVFNNLLFGLGEVFHSNVWWSRAFAMRKGVGKKAYIMAGLLWLPVPIVAGFLGLAAPALDIAIPRPDMVGPVVAATILGYAGAVLVFVVVFCSLASSIDSLLAATSDLVTKDLVQPIFMPDADERRLRSVSTWVVVAVGGITWLLCLPKMGTLASVLFFAGPMVASTIWPILYGLYRRDATGKAAVSAMLGGTIVGLVAYFTLGWYTASLIGTAVSFTLLVTITKFSSSRFDWRKLDARPEKAMEVS